MGGANRSFRFDREVATNIGGQLKKLQETYNASLFITPSRRTGPENTEVIRDILKNENTYFWDEVGDNPYFALLAWADAILVTADSVCMVSEACCMDKPVYLLPLPGHDPKFQQFHNSLIENGRVSWFTGSVDFSPAQPFNETIIVANQVLDLLKSRM